MPALAASVLSALLVAAAPGVRSSLPATRAQPVAQPAPVEADPTAAPAQPDGDEEDEGESEDADAEVESANPEPASPDIRYTRDLSDAELKDRWEHDLPSLGSISVGFADRGRLINGVHMPARDPTFVCERPDLAWGTQETIDGLVSAFHAVHAQFPDSVPGRLSHIGRQDGGWLRPHRSHQSGRDADIGLFYKDDRVPHMRGRRDRLIDPARNWALLKALLTQSDVQFVLVDRGIQHVLRDYALSVGEDPVWVNTIFSGGRHALVQHARGHRDHFHVRFYAARSYELGRRVQPLLALRPDQNLVSVRIRPRQTLGALAHTYRTTVAAIRRANHMRGSFLRVGQHLTIPLRGACTRCPLPPPLVVPARLLPRVLQDEAEASADVPELDSTALSRALRHTLPTEGRAVAAAHAAE